MSENDFNEVLNELSECREDERNSQNQVMQTIATAAAALTLILGASVFGKEDFSDAPYLLKIGIYVLCITILMTAISYVVSFGITNVLRFFYMQQLEDKLASRKDKDLDIVHWISFSAAVNTRNIKHIRNSNYTMLSYVYYSLAAFLALFFCFGIIIIQYYILNLGNALFVAIPLSFILVSFAIFIAISIKAKDMYDFSNIFSAKKQKERLLRNKLIFPSYMKENNTSVFFKGFIS